MQMFDDFISREASISLKEKSIRKTKKWSVIVPSGTPPPVKPFSWCLLWRRVKSTDLKSN